MCAGCDRIGNYSRQGQCGRTFPRTATASLRAGWEWLIPLTQVTPYPPSPRPSGLAVATDAQLHGRRSHPEPRRFLAVSGGPIACQARCGGHLS